MTVTRNRDGIPSWNGDSTSWLEYRRAALLYVETTKWESRYLCGPRLASELTGPARTSIANKKPSWLSTPEGVNRLLLHLQNAISEPVLPEVGNTLRAYFKHLRRRKGETMTSFCVRHREEYDRVCRALSRMVKTQQADAQKPMRGQRRHSWQSALGHSTSTSGPEHAPRAIEHPASSTDGSEEVPVLQGSLDASGPADDDANEPWQEWRAHSGRSWSEHGDAHWTWSGRWSDHHWQDHSWQQWEPSDDEDDEAMVDILPDIIQGWLLLEKAGLDDLEKSIIQSDIKSKFTLEGVENSLRAHWTDGQVRRRDGSDERHQANFGGLELDLDDEEGPPEWDQSYFEGWDPEDIAVFQEAYEAEQEAWAQIQEGRRTLRDARERQKAVRLGRKFFSPKGKGRGKFQGSKGRSGSESTNHGPRGPCLRRGKGHATRECPQRPAGENKKVLQVDEQSEFICFAEHQDASMFGDVADEQGLHQDMSKMTTYEAMTKGYGVLDPGATRTMGSMVALEHAREASMALQNRDNVSEVNLDDKPTFGFADSESAQCSSTVLLQLPVSDHNLKLRVHALDKGTVPVLLSIDTLKKLHAIVDYGNNEVVFSNIDPCKRVSLETTATGHQVIPLAADFMSGAQILEAPVWCLGTPLSE